MPTPVLIILLMNPLLFFLEWIMNVILWPIYFIIVCIGYVYDYFACMKVPVPHRILITGASSGIGKATAVEYALPVNNVQSFPYVGKYPIFDGER